METRRKGGKVVGMTNEAGIVEKFSLPAGRDEDQRPVGRWGRTTPVASSGNATDVGSAIVVVKETKQQKNTVKLSLSSKFQHGFQCKSTVSKIMTQKVTVSILDFCKIPFSERSGLVQILQETTRERNRRSSLAPLKVLSHAQLIRKG